MAEMKKIRVEASRGYDVCIGNGILPSIGEALQAVAGRCRITLLTDSTVDALHAPKLEKILADGGYETKKFVIPAGEASKNRESLFELLGFMARNHMTRSDLLIAMGGGVTGDLGGLAASLFLRGIKFIQVPTTLLSAVDSSVGGKTAIDIPEGKNLVGSFCQPSLVWCDTSLMSTLPEEIFRDGCAEVIKYGVILDSGLYSNLQNPPFQLEEVVARCVEIKRDVVQRDEFDNGLRGLLNFGHTFGHGIELLSDFKVSHGSAVAKGMAMAARYAAAEGISNIEKELVETLLKYGFDLDPLFSGEEIYNAALSDKKRRGDDITLVLPESIGKCILYKTPIERFHEIINRI